MLIAHIFQKGKQKRGVKLPEHRHERSRQIKLLAITKHKSSTVEICI